MLADLRCQMPASSSGRETDLCRHSCQGDVTSFTQRQSFCKRKAKWTFRIGSRHPLDVSMAIPNEYSSQQKDSRIKELQSGSCLILCGLKTNYLTDKSQMQAFGHLNSCHRLRAASGKMSDSAPLVEEISETLATQENVPSTSRAIELS